MIFYFPKCREFITYDRLKHYVNVTDALNFYAEERIKVIKEEAGTSAFNQSYDKFQVKQGKSQKRHLLEMARRKVYG